MACNNRFSNVNGITFPDFVANACCNPCCCEAVGGVNNGTCGCGCGNNSCGNVGGCGNNSCGNVGGCSNNGCGNVGGSNNNGCGNVGGSNQNSCGCHTCCCNRGRNCN